MTVSTIYGVHTWEKGGKLVPGVQWFRSKVDSRPRSMLGFASAYRSDNFESLVYDTRAQDHRLSLIWPNHWAMNLENQQFV